MIFFSSKELASNATRIQKAYNGLNMIKVEDSELASLNLIKVNKIDILHTVPVFK